MKPKHLISILAAIAVSMIAISALAHSGRTDARGGHRDKNNVSGLGSYHYHCGGRPAHLHKGGVCPYSTKAKTTPKKTPTKPQPAKK